MQELVSRSLSLLGREAAKIVLPSDCVACERPLPWRDRIASCCRSCWNELPRIEESKCRRCANARPVEESGESYICLDCHRRDWSLEWIDSWGHYRGGLEKLLHAFKFARHDFLSDPLSDLLLQTLSARRDLFFDRIVPIPMHARKRRKRGYNQAELLAIGLSRSTAIPMSRCLRKRCENRSQSHLPKAERASNVRDVFAASSLPGDRILLVDDICTTGETLDAAAMTLRDAGAGVVCAVTIARA